MRHHIIQGDCLMQVDGEPVFGKDADFVTSKIMGKIGTPIATKFRRDIMILERESRHTSIKQNS
jgi:C-terminal processing protease CtpA/Prc